MKKLLALLFLSVLSLSAVAEGVDPSSAATAAGQWGVGAAGTAGQWGAGAAGSAANWGIGAGNTAAGWVGQSIPGAAGAQGTVNNWVAGAQGAVGNWATGASAAVGPGVNQGLAAYNQWGASGNFAQSFGLQEGGALLTPPPTDKSMQYLSSIFGVVDGVLPGSGSQILGKMFGTFNAVILSLGGVILMYILIVSTLNTAHEGEVMGKKWSSIWIPVRAALGVAFLVPKASGYSIIQILMMWIVTQGIGAADSVWNTTLDYLNSGGVIVNTQQGANNPNTDATMTTAGHVLQSLTCVYSLKQALAASQSSNVPPLSTMLIPDAAYVQGGDRNSPLISFPNDPNYAGYKGVCGQMSWTAGEDPMTTSAAAQQIIADLSGTAQEIVNAAQIVDANQRNQAFSAISSAPYFYAVMDYGTLMMPLLNKGNVANSLSQQVINMKNNGWIMAGAYYSAITQNISSQLKQMAPPTLMGADLGSMTGALRQANNALFGGAFQTQAVTALSFANQYVATAQAQKGLYFPSDTPVQFQKMRGLASQLLGLKPLESATKISLDSLLSPVDDAFNKLLIESLNGVVGQLMTAGTGNPIATIALFGNMLLTASIALWGAAATVSLIVSLAAAGVSYFIPSIGSAVEVATLWMLPVIGLLVSTGFISGVMASFYIPLVPFIYFTFGAFGWLIGVIETMIAAPLVALGLMHPEGDEAFGKAAPAIMLVANVFLRPTLMLFGFIAGIIMSYIGIWLLTQGFVYAVSGLLLSGLGQSLMVGAGAGVGAGVGALFVGAAPHVLPGALVAAGAATAVLFVTTFSAIIVIYIILATTIVQKSFSLISEVPQNIMTWIGGTAHTPGGQVAQQATQEVQGKAEHAAQKGSEFLAIQRSSFAQRTKADPKKDGDGGGGSVGGAAP